MCCRSTLPLLAVTATVNFSHAVLAEAGLSFLGIGVQPPTADWGVMVAEGKTQLAAGWWISVMPGLALLLLLLCAQLLGDMLSPADVGRAGLMLAALDLRDLHVEIAGPAGLVRAVRGVSLRIAPGEVLGLVGESGSGKSMTALSVAGLTPSAARVRFSHLSVADRMLTAATPAQWRTLRQEAIGFVFQNPMRALNPRLTVGALIREALPAGERDVRSAYRRALGLMDAVGIDRARERVRQYPHELSGGLAQRVVIALALARRPRLLIADEPTTALDVSVQAQILDLIEQLRREHGLGVLLVSHDLEVIGDRVDRVAVMFAGEIVESGSCEAVIRRPEHRYTRALLAATPGRLIAERAAGAAAALPANGPTTSRPLVEAVAVSRSFALAGLRLPWQPASRRSAVRGVTLAVRPGESLGIVGESGSGKTTLARLLARTGHARGWGDPVRRVRRVQIRCRRAGSLAARRPVRVPGQHRGP